MVGRCSSSSVAALMQPNIFATKLGQLQTMGPKPPECRGLMRGWLHWGTICSSKSRDLRYLLAWR